MPRFGLEVALDTNPITRGGRLAEGLYISDVNGNLTYFGSGTAYEGVTFESSYDVYWFEVLQGGNALALGENLPIIVLGTGTYPSINLVMWRGDTFLNDSTGGLFSYNLSDIGSPLYYYYLLEGNSITIPSNIDNVTISKTHFGAFGPDEGDYNVTFTQTDPNGVQTGATNDPVVGRYSPYVFITEIDGNRNMRDALPPVNKSSVQVKYIKGANVATEVGGVPIYGAGGEIGYTGGQELTITYPLVEGVNSIQVVNMVNGANTSDSFITAKSSDIKQLSATIPEGGLPQESNILQNIEGIGDIINILTYDPANGYVFAEDVIGTATNVNVFVDQGFTSATSFLYQLDFTSGDYRNYTFNIPYTNPITLEIFYVEVTVEYKATLVYEDFATNLMHFGDPTGGTPANVTIINDTVDKYQDVFDLVELGTGLSETTPADMPLVTVNAVGKNGAEMVISDVITLTKAYSGNEGWHTPEHCFVITFQVPTARGPYFEFPTIEIGSGTVLQFLDFGAGFKVGAQGTLGSITHTIRDYVTFLVGKDSSGDLRFYSSGGDDVNLGAFAGWSANDLLLGNTDDRQTTDAIFYEISCIDHFPDATERTDIYARSATKWETV
jgi:hypothetical protein